MDDKEESKASSKEGVAILSRPGCSHRVGKHSAVSSSYLIPTKGLIETHDTLVLTTILVRIYT
eukprot:scaffold9948_cov129-Cylindrotheca_fusiformis.AAC.8